MMRSSRGFHDTSVRHIESMSPFDLTNAPRVLKPGDLPSSRRPISASQTTRPISAGSYLRSRSGFGGSSTTLLKETRRPVSRDIFSNNPGRPQTSHLSFSQSSFAPRSNPPNSNFRFAFERGDLPCLINQNGSHRTLKWKVPVESLDYNYYLPLFFDGLREEEIPLDFVPYAGIVDLVRVAPERIVETVPHLVQPIRNAFVTRRVEPMKRTIDAMKLLISSTIERSGISRVAVAFVPHLKYFLANLRVFLSKYDSKRGIDEGNRQQESLDSKITSLLNLLELHGGPDAFMHIKYMVPVYVSCKGL